MDKTKIAAKTRSVLNCGPDNLINHPKPPLEPIHSPITAPITESTTATFIPEKICGKAFGT